MIVQLTRLEYEVMQEFSRAAARRRLVPVGHRFEPAVLYREFTGVGSWVWFVRSPAVDGEVVKLSDVEIEFPDLGVLAGAILELRDGTPVELEMFTYDDPWPEDGAEFVVRRSRDD